MGGNLATEEAKVPASEPVKDMATTVGGPQKPTLVTSRVSDGVLELGGTMSKTQKVYVQFENHGSIILVGGLSEVGRGWMDDNVGDNETQYFSNVVVAKPRYCRDIFVGAHRVGLAVRQ